MTMFLLAFRTNMVGLWYEGQKSGQSQRVDYAGETSRTNTLPSQVGAVQRESCPELPRKTPSQIHGGITGNLSVLSLYCFQPAGVASNPLRICHTCQRVKLARTFAPRTIFVARWCALARWESLTLDWTTLHVRHVIRHLFTDGHHVVQPSQENNDESRIEVAPAFAAEVLNHAVDCPGVFVRPRGQEGVE